MQGAAAKNDASCDLSRAGASVAGRKLRILAGLRVSSERVAVKLHESFLMSTTIAFMGIALFFTFISYIYAGTQQSPSRFQCE